MFKWIAGWVWPTTVTEAASILGVVATFAAVAIALWVAGRDGRRTKKADERRQASQVSAWGGFVVLGPRGEAFQDIVAILNGSDAPIWDVCVSAGAQHGDAPLYGEGNSANRCITIVPPGKYRVQKPDGFQNPATGVTLDAAISFRDAEGRFWRRDATGILTRTKKHPFEELHITRPPTWGEAFIMQMWKGD